MLKNCRQKNMVCTFLSFLWILVFSCTTPKNTKKPSTKISKKSTKVEKEPEIRYYTKEKLIQLIKANIAPHTWKKGDVSIAETSGQLLIVHSKKVQQQIQQLLDDMRNFNEKIVIKRLHKRQNNIKEEKEEKEGTEKNKANIHIEQELKEKLDKKISLDFVEVPLEDFLQYIRYKYGIHIVFTPKIVAALKNTKVNIKVVDIKLEVALSIVLQPYGLTFHPKNNALYIALLTRPKLVPYLHDIRDLIGELPDFSGSKIQLATERKG